MDEGVGAEGLAEADDGHLRGVPARVRGDLLDGFLHVVEDQVTSGASHDEGVEAGALSVTHELEIADVVVSAEDLAAQGAEVLAEFGVRVVGAGPEVVQDIPVFAGQPGDDPFIE